MRRLFVAVLLCASVGLIAATPAPKSTQAPRPAPTFSAAPVPTGTVPVVMVYPFQTPSDLDQRYGAAIAQIYAQVFTDTGGIKVLAIPQNIRREDYAKYAAVQHADYYISGYIQPIGDGAAIVSEIFDVVNDIGVTSQTTQIQNVNDVGSQALTARTVILARAGVDRPQIVVAQATATPNSTSSGASVSVGNVLNDLFKGKSKSGKSVATAATAAPPKPVRSVIATQLTGQSPVADLASASTELAQLLAVHYNTTLNNSPIGDIAKQADGICGKNRDNTIATGVFDTSHSGGYHPHDSYKFTLNIVTCFGATLYTTTQTGNDRTKVIKAAVDAYVNDHPDNN